MKSTSTRPLVIVGPKPTSLGGIASIVRMLRTNISRENVHYLSNTKSKNKLANTFRPLLSIFKIFLYSIFYKRGDFIIFSSAGISFWEKLVWGQVIGALRSRVFIIMVDGNFPDYYETLPKKLQRLAGFLASRVQLVAQSESWALYYKEIFKLSNVSIVAGGVETSFFKNLDNKKENSRLTLLFVGWLFQAKGLYDLLNAAKQLKDRKRSFSLHLVGPFVEPREKIEEIINNLGLTEETELIGPIFEKEKLLYEYQGADIFILPSHNEGFPVALLEALSCALPCIGSDVGGIPDIINSEECGLVFKKGDVSALANSIDRLINNNQERMKMASSSRKRAIERYSIEECVKTYLDLVKENEE